MHYVACRFHQMQKHKFDIMDPDALFMKTAPPSMKNSASKCWGQKAEGHLIPNTLGGK
jgi:hypothetical protein